MALNRRSKERLTECHTDLQRLVRAVAEENDLYVLKGFRGEVEQNEAYDKGNSKLKFPESKHNVSPALAVDISFKPLDWSKKESFDLLGVIVKAKAKELGISIRWGGDFESFFDGVHFEISDE